MYDWILLGNHGSIVIPFVCSVESGTSALFAVPRHKMKPIVSLLLHYGRTVVACHPGVGHCPVSQRLHSELSCYSCLYCHCSVPVSASW
jgi:hypothetical protein